MTKTTNPERQPDAGIDPAAGPGLDLVPEDDAVIGRAFRWSLVVIVIVAVMIAGGLWLVNRDDGTGPVPIDDGPIQPPPPLPAGQAPGIPFTDVAATAGVAFEHVNGAVGEKLLPETMGAGVAVFDYDGDGDEDLLFVNARPWPWDHDPGDRLPTLALYRNDGSARFDDVTAEAGLAVSLYGMGVACGDIDNDGDADVYVTAVGGNRLFRNDGGRFTDVTAEAGVAGGDTDWSTSAAFFDANNDGLLDLFVCSYIVWSREDDLRLNYTLNGRDRAYGPPTNRAGAHSYLFMNEGGGRFRDVSAEAGLHVVNPATGGPVGKSLALRPIDFDDDGDLDVIVANDTTQNFLFVNDGTGRFEDRGDVLGVAFSNAGKATGAMGIDAGFYCNDGDLAVAIGNFANEMTSLYVRQTGDTLFSDLAIVDGIGSPSRIALSFGVFFFDYDLDGRVDLLQANGHLEEAINQIQVSQHYRQPAQLFWNAGRGARTTFVEAPRETTGDLARPIVGRGAAYGDLDGDGDLDVVLTQVGGPPLVLRNDRPVSGGHWLRVRLVGAGAVSRDAIGAVITLTAGGRTQRREVMPTRSYLSQVTRSVTFGLAGADRVERLEIRWPDGHRQAVVVAEVDREMIVELK